MSSVDLIIDIETLGRLLTEMKVPKELFNNYVALNEYIEEKYSTHPHYESVKKLISTILARSVNP